MRSLRPAKAVTCLAISLTLPDASDLPSELMRERDTFTGQQLDYDNKTGIAHLTGKVRGILHPAARK